MEEHAGSGPAGPEAPQGPPEDLLSSWKEIAVYLGTTVRTVQRWEQETGLPVRRLLHKRKASVYAYKSEIETWRASRDVPPEVAAALGGAVALTAPCGGGGSLCRVRLRSPTLTASQDATPGGEGRGLLLFIRANGSLVGQA